MEFSYEINNSVNFWKIRGNVSTIMERFGVLMNLDVKLIGSWLQRGHNVRPM